MNPQTPEELAQALGCAAARGETIRLGGHFSKDLMAGPVAPAAVTISTAALNRVLQYDPRDLTISVEAGVPFAELNRVVGEHRQMVPLDPPFSGAATVGGVIATNLSGPRRRFYGTARDMVIGMQFATLEGKLVQSGGMVVKNVAGLDMAKLMIGSFGTLAAVTVVNFKLVPAPPHSRTFLLRFESAADALRTRNTILDGVLQPAAIDLLNEQAARRVGETGVLLLIRASGNAAVIDRYARELPDAEGLSGDAEASLWERVRDFTPQFLAERPQGAVVRISCTLSRIEAVVTALDVAAVVRAGSGVVYGYFPQWEDAGAWVGQASGRGWKTVVEFAPQAGKDQLDLWPAPGNDLDLMRRVKHLFDPGNLLNPGRLYGRI